MILAGDVGGTKTLIGLYQPAAGRPVPLDVRSFPTTAYPGLPAIVEAFFAAQGARPAVETAAFGVAGPVIDQVATMTNVDWQVDAAELEAAFGLASVRLLNDLEAMAYAVPVLDGAELHTLQAGLRHEGNLGVIAAGTGLGGALLHRTGGRFVPVPSEIGHSDFAARTDRELDFVRFCRERFGRAEIEHVLSGPGLVNVWAFTHQQVPCEAIDASTPPVAMPAEISRAALEHQCEACREALDVFVEAYGAVAGNLALTAVTTGGLFIGGGIAPRILPALSTGRLIAAFNDKGPMRPLLERVPVHVILNADAGLLGAAVYANDRIRP